MNRLSRTNCSLVALALTSLLAVGGCGPSSPTMAILTPAQGSIRNLASSGTTVVVEGQLFDVDLSSTIVRLWWDEVGAPADAVVATLQPSTGRFTATMTLPAGANPVYRMVVAEARYGPGGAQVLRAANGFVLAEDSAHVGYGGTETVTLRVNDSGLDKLEPWLSGIASSQIDLGALVGSGDLLGGNDPCVVNGPFGSCLLRVTMVQLWDDALGNVHVGLNSETEQVRSWVGIDAADLTLRVRGKAIGINYTCDVLIRANNVIVSGAYALEPMPGNPSLIDVAQVGNAIVNVGWSSNDLDCAGVLGGMVGDLVQWILHPDVTQPLENALGTAVNGTSQPIAQAFEAALADLSLGQTLGGVLQADLHGHVDRVPEDVDGVPVAAGIAPTPLTTLCDPGGPFEAYGILCPSFGAFYQVPTSMPAGLGAGTPTPQPVPYDLALGLSDTAFSSLFKTLATQGHFSGRVTELESCRTYAPDLEPLDGPELTYKCLLGNDPFLCTLLGVDCAAPLQILHYPAMPIVARGGYGEGGAMGDLVAQMTVDVMTDPARNGTPGLPALVVRLQLLFDASFDLVVDESGPEPRLGLETALCFMDEPGLPCEPNVRIVTTYARFGNPYIGPNLIDLFVLADGGLVEGTLVSAMNSAVETFPLPTLLNLSLDPVLIKRHGGFNGAVALFANLVN